MWHLGTRLGGGTTAGLQDLEYPFQPFNSSKEPSAQKHPPAFSLHSKEVETWVKIPFPAKNQSPRNILEELPWGRAWGETPLPLTHSKRGTAQYYLFTLSISCLAWNNLLITPRKNIRSSSNSTRFYSCLTAHTVVKIYHQAMTRSMCSHRKIKCC